MAEAESTPRIVTDVPRLAPRPPDMHKGLAGRVAIVAGSRGMSGAACLAGLAALRGGAGLVRVYAPVSVQPIVAMSEPGLMTVGLPEDEEGRFAATAALVRLEADRGWPTAVALGPGLGQGPALGGLVAGVLRLFDVPVVVDADGLNALATGARTERWWEVRSSRALVVTPHPGEMARLRAHAGLTVPDGQDDETRRRVACEFAELTGAVTVLKGRGTVVASREAIYVNATGNPGMATGGMGDVLTGLIAALLAQGLAAFDAAVLGVHAHGSAADCLARQMAPAGYLAREVADMLPAALADASRERMGFK